VKVVPRELEAVIRHSQVGLRRFLAFERWLQAADTSHVAFQPEERRENDFWVRAPTLQRLLATVGKPALLGEEYFKPIIELIESVLKFLEGHKWPDAERAPGNREVEGTQADDVDIACTRAFGDKSDSFASSWLPKLAVRRRAQSLLRESRLFDLFFLLYRMLRKSRISHHLLFNEPSLLKCVLQIERIFVAGAKDNERTQVYIASSSYQTRFLLDGYENSWLAEQVAVAIEWSSSEFAQDLRSGRPSLLIQVMVADNKLLTSLLVDDRVAQLLVANVIDHGLHNHSVALVSRITGSGGSEPIASTQNRILAQWMRASVTKSPIKAYFGFFFVRDRFSTPQTPSPTQHAAAQNAHHTYTDTSLLNAGADRIFRLCVLIGPSDRLEAQYGSAHWCLGCHLSPFRHRHGKVFGTGDSTGSASLAEFLAEGNLRAAATFHPEDPVESDRLLPEVVRWTGPTISSRITTEAQNPSFVDLAQLVSLARNSSEHAQVVRYITSMLDMYSTSATGNQSRSKEMLQQFFPYEILISGINLFALGSELRSAFVRLLDVIFVDRYPHFQLESCRSLLLVDSDAISTSEIVLVQLSQYSFHGHSEAIEPHVALQLSNDDEALVLGPIISEPGDDFVYSACNSMSLSYLFIM
jgi:hypothetical protein